MRRTVTQEYIITGTAYSFGHGYYGRLGHGGKEDQLTPKVISRMSQPNDLPNHPDRLSAKRMKDSMGNPFGQARPALCGGTGPV